MKNQSAIYLNIITRSKNIRKILAASILICLCPVNGFPQLSYVNSIVRKNISGLDRANHLAITRDGKYLYVASYGSNALNVFLRDHHTGELTFLESLVDGQNGNNGLEGAYYISIPPDEKNIYVAAFMEDAVGVFYRDTVDGKVSCVESVREGMTGAGKVGITHMDFIDAVVATPDNKMVIIGSRLRDGFMVFNRDSANGAMYFVQRIARQRWNGIPNLGHIYALTCSHDSRNLYVGTSRGIHVFTFTSSHDFRYQQTLYGSYIYSISVSKDDKNIYAASMMNGLYGYSRDPETGLLTQIEMMPAKQLNHTHVSPDGKNVYATSWYDSLIIVFSRDPVTGELSFLQQLRQGRFGAIGLAGASSIVVSPDNRHAYVTTTFDRSLSVFDRDTATGRLTLHGVISEGAENLPGLQDVRSLCMSGDGNNIYAVSGKAGMVSVFHKKYRTSELYYQGAVTDGKGGADYLGGAYSALLSPDQKYLYVTAAEDDAISIFSRDIQYGTLSLAGYVKNGEDGIDGLDGPHDAAVDAGGDFLYVASPYEGAIVSFSRDPATGGLSYAGRTPGGLNGLDGVCSVVVSNDDKHLYAASPGSDAVLVFERGASGSLSLIQVLRDGEGDIRGLQGARKIAVNLAGSNVYVLSGSEHSLVTFQRDPGTGRLSFLDAAFDEREQVDGLRGASSLVVNEKDKFIYVASSDDHGIAVFSTDPATGIPEYVMNLKDFMPAVDYMKGVSSVVATPDYRYLYAAAPLDNAISIFSIDAPDDSGKRKFGKAKTPVRDVASVFPNPSPGPVFFRFEQDHPGEMYINIHDIQGRCLRQDVFRQIIRNQQYYLDLSSLKPGLYILRITGHDCQQSVRIIRE